MNSHVVFSIPRSLLRDFTRWGIPKGEKRDSPPWVARANSLRAERNQIGKIPCRLRRGIFGKLVPGYFPALHSLKRFSLIELRIISGLLISTRTIPQRCLDASTGKAENRPVELMETPLIMAELSWLSSAEAHVTKNLRE